MYLKLTIIGNLGKDPDLRYTPSGQAVTSFSVATSRTWTGSDGQRQEETVWIRVTTWNKLAETCNQYLQKGKQVFCEGRLTVDKATGGPRIWTDQNGASRASYEMTAMTVKFLGSKGDSGGGYSDNQSMDGGGETESKSIPDNSSGITEDEIPF